MPSDYFLVVDIVNLMLSSGTVIMLVFIRRVACCWCPTILCGE